MSNEELAKLVDAMNIELSARTWAAEAVIRGLLAELEQVKPGISEQALAKSIAGAEKTEDPRLKAATIAAYKRMFTRPSGGSLHPLRQLREAFDYLFGRAGGKGGGG